MWGEVEVGLKLYLFRALACRLLLAARARRVNSMLSMRSKVQKADVVDFFGFFFRGFIV